MPIEIEEEWLDEAGTQPGLSCPDCEGNSTSFGEICEECYRVAILLKAAYLRGRQEDERLS